MREEIKPGQIYQTIISSDDAIYYEHAIPLFRVPYEGDITRGCDIFWRVLLRTGEKVVVNDSDLFVLQKKL